jgi:hypothetical protein
LFNPSNSNNVTFQVPQGQRKLFPRLKPEWLDKPIGALIEILHSNKFIGAKLHDDKTIILRAAFRQDMGIDALENDEVVLSSEPGEIDDRRRNAVVTHSVTRQTSKTSRIICGLLAEIFQTRKN